MKKKLFLYLLLLGVAVGLFHILWGVFNNRKVKHTQLTYASPKIPPELDGYRIAFVTDVHSFPKDRLVALVTEIQEKNPNLLLLGGDFSYLPDKMRQDLEIISKIAPPDGIYGVEGNHDNHVLLAQELEKYGGTLLLNQGVKVREGLFVGGVEDLWNGLPDPDKALTQAGDNFTVLLAHNPDTSMHFSLAGADLVLSGHTHGGEFKLFGLWRPALSLVTDYGSRFASGWCKGAEDVDVYVSTGVGGHLPVRMFVSPQVVYIDLVAEDN